MTARLNPGRSAAAALLLSGFVLTGCETDSYFDPSAVGRWERTPASVPILDRIAAIEESDTGVPVSSVQQSDLFPDKIEYTLTEGDQVQITIFQFLNAGVDSVFQRRVDATGKIRLPNLGEVEVSGRTPSELEADIVGLLARRDIIQDAQVTITALTRQEATYSILGQPDQDRTRFGTYIIPRPNFRLLDAIAVAGGIDGRVKTLRVIRQVPLDERVRGVSPDSPRTQDPSDTERPAGDELIEGIEGAIDAGDAGSTRRPDEPEDRATPPEGVDVQTDSSQPEYVFVDGKYVRVSPGENAARDNGETDSQYADQMGFEPDNADQLNNLISQRIIEVPYDRLRRGDMRYNIVIRPGDIITVPERAAGFVYIMGATARPGAYTVPGENELTLKQLIASSGGLSGIAWPTRVDLVRRTGPNQEAVIRLNLKAIFEMTEPDVFLKPNDLINVGTSFVATPLAVFRSGLRTTYGVGFILDRNFNTDVFGAQ